MRYFEYWEYSDGGIDVHNIISEEEIIYSFMDRYSRLYKLSHDDEYTREMCIEDFCTNNWATEVKY